MADRFRAGLAGLLVTHWPLDVAIAVSVAVVNVWSTLAPDPSASYYDYRQPQQVWFVSLTAGAGIALLWRRYAPVTVYLVTLGVFALVTYLEWQAGSLPAGTMVAMYSVGAFASRRGGLVSLAALTAVVAGLIVLGKPYYDHWSSLIVLPVYGGPWFVGRVVLFHRLNSEQERARALELEREQAIAAERAVHEERLRIAREFHDVVSHTLTVINVQASVAHHLLGETPSEGGQALAIIEDSSRAALEDLRRMLGVLRGDGDRAMLAPTPGLDELQLLAAAHRASHGPVEMAVDGAVASAPTSLRLTVFRLVQESLTNIARHARGATARVSVQAEGDQVVVTVTDDGNGAACGAPAGGYGLAGMRERVALFGGSLETGPRLDGGFEVRAVLPLEGER